MGWWIDPDIEKKIAEGDLILVTEVAAQFNYSRQAVYQWARTNRVRLTKYKNRRYMSLAALERFGKGRVKGSIKVASRPQGWPTRKSIELEIGGATTFLKRLEEEGKIRCVRYRGIIYVHPEDAEYAKEKYKKFLAPQIGWELLSNIAESVGRTPKAVLAWANTHKIEMRKFRHPERGQPVWHMREEDARRYRRASRRHRRALERGARRRAQKGV